MLFLVCLLAARWRTAQSLIFTANKPGGYANEMTVSPQYYQVPQQVDYFVKRGAVLTDAHSGLPTCNSLIDPGNMLFADYADGTQGWAIVPLQWDTTVGPPQSANTLASNETCCLNNLKTHANGCRTGVHNEAYVWTMTWSYEAFDYGTGFSTGTVDTGSPQCTGCARYDAGPTHCSDGQYATDFLDKDDDGYIMNAVQCLPCEPGTWMACIDGASCSWPIPLKGDTYLANGDWYSLSGHMPVGQCYDCRYAERKAFYQSSPVKKSVIEVWSSSLDQLPWYCPGNMYSQDGVPRYCSNPFVGSSPDFSYCVCAAGSYYDGANGCLLCDTGHFCANGVRTECPDDHYQPNVGQTVCLPCPVGQASTVCSSGLLVKCTGAQKAMPLKCVGCNQCNKAYTDNAAGKFDCYMS